VIAYLLAKAKAFCTTNADQKNGVNIIYQIGSWGK